MNNYVRELNQQIANGTIALKPGVLLVDIFHDDWYSLLSGGKCDCQPEVRQRTAAAAAAAGSMIGPDIGPDAATGLLSDVVAPYGLGSFCGISQPAIRTQRVDGEKSSFRG